MHKKINVRIVKYFTLLTSFIDCLTLMELSRFRKIITVSIVSTFIVRHQALIGKEINVKTMSSKAEESLKNFFSSPFFVRFVFPGIVIFFKRNG